MRFLKVPKKQAEKIRQQLVENGILNGSYKLIREKVFVLIPVKKKHGDFEVVEREGEKFERTPSLKEYLSSFLKPEELEQVTGSYDIIGDIAIIEVPESLEKKKKKIAEAILKIHKNVKTVLRKLGAMEGVFRTRKMKHVAGEKRTTTLYTEHGVKMMLDVSKVYFSVRLSNERKRIASQVKKGEKILALFAGVGPFPLVISKKHPDAEIVAIELNPVAVEFMHRNVVLNKASNIRVIEGDVRKVVPRHYEDWADRIIMPLPKSAETFLDVAAKAAKDGCIVHLYVFAGGDDPEKEAENRLNEIAEKSGIKYELLNARIVRPYAPRVYQIVLDIKIKK